jgi:hypothetical protein
MSSAKTPEGKEPASLQSTREMLDELDALMDRMLALPVNDLEEATSPARETVRMPMVSATLTVLESPAAEAEAPARSETPPPRETTPTYRTDLAPASTEVASAKALASMPQVEAEPVPEEAIPPSIMNLTVPSVKLTPVVTPLRVPRRSVAGMCLLPLLWFDRGFDLVAGFLGRPGHWLRGPRGRHFLGMTGLTLLVVAGLWLVKDWLGWTW